MRGLLQRETGAGDYKTQTILSYATGPFEVLTRIKESCATMPVIILTAHGTEKDRQECMRQGAYAFMHKPLRIEALVTILAHIKETSA